MSSSILACHLQEGKVMATLFVRGVKLLSAAGLACGRPMHEADLELAFWKKENKLLEPDLEKTFSPCWADVNNNLILNNAKEILQGYHSSMLQAVYSWRGCQSQESGQSWNTRSESFVL